MNDFFIRHLTICAILMCCSCSQLSKESEASVFVYTSSSSDQKIEELATAIRGAFFPETKATSYDVQEISYLLSGTDTLAISVDFSNDNGFVVISQTDLTPLCVMTGGSLNYGWGGDANGYFLSRRERTKQFPGEEEGSYSVPISLFDTYYNTIYRIVTHIKPS